MATYRRGRRNRLMMGGVAALLSAASLVVIATFVAGRIAGDPMPPAGIVAFMAVWTCGVNWMAVREFFVEPIAIETTTEGLRFDARWRPTEVRWADLQEVRSPLNDPFRSSAVWSWRGGKRRTWTAYDGWPQLLSETEHRAPHAHVRGY